MKTTLVLVCLGQLYAGMLCCGWFSDLFSGYLSWSLSNFSETDFQVPLEISEHSNKIPAKALWVRPDWYLRDLVTAIESAFGLEDHPIYLHIKDKETGEEVFYDQEKILQCYHSLSQLILSPQVTVSFSTGAIGTPA